MYAVVATDSQGGSKADITRHAIKLEWGEALGTISLSLPVSTCVVDCQILDVMMVLSY